MHEIIESQRFELTKRWKRVLVFHEEGMSANVTWVQGPLLLTWIKDILQYGYVNKSYIKCGIKLPNFNGYPDDVWELIRDFILHAPRYVVTYPCRD